MSEQKITFGLHKLVRDKLPDMMQELGQDVELRTIQGDEHIRALITKVEEELAELDPDSETYLKELADLKQTILDLINLTGEPEKVEELRIKDFEKRGGFLAGKYIANLHLQPNDPWVEYYRQDPERFPETP